MGGARPSVRSRAGVTVAAAITADFKTAPYFHQLREFELSAEAPARALLWQMRTGKTKVVIDTACHLKREGLIDAVVLFAPKGVHENWVRRELPLHHWDSVERLTLSWRSSTAGDLGVKRVPAGERALWQARHDAWWNKSRRLLGTDALAWFAFNSESMTRDDVRRLVARVVRDRRTLIVFDESHDFRTPGSKRTKMARAVARRCPYRRILTGTSVTNSPLHAFSQYELLEPGALGHTTYGAFKKHHAEYRLERTRAGRHYPVLSEYKDLDGMQERMARWSSVVLRDDCEDLPDVVRSSRRIDLNDEQLRLYRELHRQFTLELNDREVSVGENTSRLIKLQQVVSGFLVDEFGDVHDVPGPNPRLEAVSDEVYLSPGKVIVWCRFREDMDRVASRLTADGHEVVQYHGRVSDEEKVRVRELFAPDAQNDVKVLVGYPTLGLDLSAAYEIVWYSHTFDAILREQADERATAMGGLNVPIVDIVAPGVDEYILENVSDKVSVADALAGRGMREALKRMEL